MAVKPWEQALKHLSTSLDVVYTILTYISAFKGYVVVYSPA